MPATRIELDGFDRLLRALDGGKVRASLRRNVRTQIRRSTQLLRRDVIRYIDAERHGVPNSPLTVLVKGSAKPLVDRGDLRQGIETDDYETSSSVVGSVGVTRSRTHRGADGKSKRLINIAMSLHEGTTMRMTEKRRKAVFAAMKARQGRSVSFKGSGSRVWRIRGRPFIRAPFEEFIPKAKRLITMGVQRTIDEL